TAEKAIAGDPFIHLLEAFLQPRSGRGAIVERRARAHVADVADVIVESLDLERDAADEPGARGRGRAHDLLERLAGSEAVRHGARSTDALGQVERVERRETFHPLLDSAMGVEQPCVEI